MPFVNRILTSRMVLRSLACIFAGSLLAACRDAREQAVLDLEKRGIAATPAALTDAVRRRDELVIGFMEVAGVRSQVPAEGLPSDLQLAAEARDWPLAGRLLTLASPEIVNHAGPDGQVILEQAVVAGEWALADRLLSAGAKPELASTGPDHLLRVAAAAPELMDRMQMALPEGHPALAAALLRAVAGGEADRVQRLLGRKAPAGAVSPEGNGSALELACSGGFEAIAGQLLEAGAEPGNSPMALPFAVERKNSSLVKLLLEAGASPMTPGDPASSEITPLGSALESGQTGMAGLMLAHGADAGVCLDFALTRGDAALMEVVLANGIPVDRPGPDGNPPLVRAAISGHLPLLEKLLKDGAPLQLPGALGQSAYHMAVIHRQAAVVDALLAAGMPADAPFRKPAPPELVPLFESDYFAKWYGRDDGLTPLMLAAARGDTAQLRQLLDGGAKRGAQTRDWHRYPIVFACDTVNIPAAQILLGRDPDKETGKRHAVISLSRQRVTLFENDQPVRSADVSTGRQSHPTPPGKYVITDKQANWVSSIYKVPMPYFMRLSCKDIGLHEGAIPGYPASHGCIRMPKRDVQIFYKSLRIGDPVTIEP